jgi:hypothetical protein
LEYNYHNNQVEQDFTRKSTQSILTMARWLAETGKVAEGKIDNDE